MEKLSQMKNNFFKFLPKQPVASVAFHQNLSHSRSPVSISPEEARRKHKGGGMSFSTAKQEPFSPKVSCMGQVQCKNKKTTQKHKRVKLLEMKNKSDSPSVSCTEKKEEERILVWISKLGSGGEGPKQSGKAFVVEEKASSASVEAPSLGTMKTLNSRVVEEPCVMLILHLQKGEHVTFHCSRTV